MTIEELRKQYQEETEELPFVHDGYGTWLEQKLTQPCTDIAETIKRIMYHKEMGTLSKTQLEVVLSEFKKMVLGTYPSCPECEKHKRAVERLISHEDFCPFKQPCLNPDNNKAEVCKECVRKWAYEEGER